jgi:hypothetical protein
LESQSKYHSQYELKVEQSRNCADKIKASENLIVIVCSKNAAITVLRRYPDSSINTRQPLVDEKGLPGNWGQDDSTGLSIGFIKQPMNTYVFVS